MKQLRFPEMRSFRPPRPELTDEPIARAVAERLVAALNDRIDCWEESEIPQRVEEITNEIIRTGRPAIVIGRLHQRQPPISCRGQRSHRPYGWEGLEDHCWRVADSIAAEVVGRACELYESAYY